MKKIAVIPARYESTRFPGKPLADIHGKPMIWWVQNEARKVKQFDDVIVAADNEKVIEACNKYGMNAIMTSSEHKTHVERLHEVSQKIKADFYVCVCGDEPLTKHETMEQILPGNNENPNKFFVSSLMREFDDPAEALDPSNIKVVANEKNECLLLTRSMVPFPYKSLSFKFKKLVGIECYTRPALEFFANQPVGVLEKIEDVTLLRYVENFKPLRLVMTDAHQLGVDTPKDLERVKEILQCEGFDEK
ncbi:MAG: 3-deoxy-manno-octulosonate cytidylyltransferase [Leptospirales bacterium]|nr:3-deoxy-manno-octulosonate cytidylyltransferase [Leptospirales bacterium]